MMSTKKNITTKQRKKFTKKGFTLVELTLSIAFIGVLSLTIALIINDTIATYRRGLTLNQVNSVGMDLVDDMRTAFQNSTSKSVLSECESLYQAAGASSSRALCKDDKGKKLVSVTRTATVRVKKNSNEDIAVPVYGALCTGTYSYIWNSGYFFNSKEYQVLNATKATYKHGDETKQDFRLLKVQDKTRAICSYTMLDNAANLTSAPENPTYKKGDIPNTHTGVFVTSPNESITEDPIDILATDNNDTTLALYDLQSTAPISSNANNSMFYSVSFILGTIDGGVNIKSKGNFCSTPTDYTDSNLDYCAINKFNFAVQATGE